MTLHDSLRRARGLASGSLALALMFAVFTACAGSAAGAPAAPPTGAETLQGAVIGLASSVDGSGPPSVSLLVVTDAGTVSVTIAAGALITGPDGAAVSLAAVRPRTTIRAEGHRLSDTEFEAVALQMLP